MLTRVLLQKLSIVYEEISSYTIRGFRGAHPSLPRDLQLESGNWKL